MKADELNGSYKVNTTMSNLKLLQQTGLDTYRSRLEEQLQEPKRTPNTPTRVIDKVTLSQYDKAPTEEGSTVRNYPIDRRNDIGRYLHKSA